MQRFRISCLTLSPSAPAPNSQTGEAECGEGKAGGLGDELGIELHAKPRGLDGILHAYDLNSGTTLWSADLGASASGGIAIANGVVVVGAATPAFAPFIRTGNTVQAFAVAQEIASPVASPVS